jgi:hypothetical protein
MPQKYTLRIDMPDGFTWGELVAALRYEADGWEDLGGNPSEAIPNHPEEHSGVALIVDPEVGVRIVGEWKFQNTEAEEG